MQPTERLGELRRLPVAHPCRDFANGQRCARQHLPRAAHADTGQALPERDPGLLAEAALQSPSRRRDRACDVVDP